MTPSYQLAPTVFSLRNRQSDTEHYVSICVYICSAGQCLQIGESEKRVFARSTVKLFQALPILNSGAASSYGLSEEELAITIASHDAERQHVALVRSILRKCDISEDDLQCGVHPLWNERERHRIILEQGHISAIHNNCSGKHAGLLATAKKLGVSNSDIFDPGGLLQSEIRAILESVFEVKIPYNSLAIDGCGLPTYRMSPFELARGFARLGNIETRIGSQLGSHFNRLLSIGIRHPRIMGGTNRYDSDAMKVFREKLYLKVGASGIYVGALLGEGIGFCVRSGDGCNNAAKYALHRLLEVLHVFLFSDNFDNSQLQHGKIKNGRDEQVGEFRLSSEMELFLRRFSCVLSSR